MLHKKYKQEYSWTPEAVHSKNYKSSRGPNIIYNTGLMLNKIFKQQQYQSNDNKIRLNSAMCIYQ